MNKPSVNHWDGSLVEINHRTVPCACSPLPALLDKVIKY